jgi:hypothetical protein
MMRRFGECYEPEGSVEHPEKAVIGSEEGGVHPIFFSQEWHGQLSETARDCSARLLIAIAHIVLL